MTGAGHKLAKPRSDRIVVEFSALKSATSGRRWVLAADHGIFFRCQTAPLKYSYILGGMFSWCACATCLRTASEYWKRSPQMRQCHWSRAKMYGRHSMLFGSSLGLGIFKSCKKNRTRSCAHGASPDAPWQNRTHAPQTGCSDLLNHLVGAGEQRRRHLKAQGFGGLKVDDQLEFRGLHHRQICRLLALESPAGVDANLAIALSHDRAVAHQTANRGELA